MAEKSVGGEARVTPIRSRKEPQPATGDEQPAPGDDQPPAESITDVVNAFLARERAEARGTEGVMTYTQSVQAFIAASDWLGPEHMPAVVSLRRIAGELDVELSAALAGQFGVTFRDLRAQAPQTPDDDDPVEAALRQREKGAKS